MTRMCIRFGWRGMEELEPDFVVRLTGQELDDPYGGEGRASRVQIGAMYLHQEGGRGMSFEPYVADPSTEE
jgi:hypothetical protein